MRDPLWTPGAGDGPDSAPTIDGDSDTLEAPAPGSPSLRGATEDSLPRFVPDEALTAEHPGRYVLRGALGEGGIGLVDRVFDRHLRRDVAIKILKPEVAARADRGRIEARLAAEARVTARLAHPGIVPVHELGRRADGTLYYAMKRVEGQTLRDALHQADAPARLGLLPRYVALCQAVAYAHDQGFIHRDLKPANIMLGAFGETLVLDWGIACRAADHTPHSIDPEMTLDDEPGLGQTIDGAVLGTPQYMSPEQITGDRDAVDARTDVYALGVILYQLLTGEMPFPERTVSALLARGPHTEAPDPLAVEPAAPPELAAITRRALAPRPAHRYPHAGALLDDALAFQAGRLVDAHRYTRREHIARWLRRNRGPLIVAAAVLLAGVATWIGRGEREAERRSAAEAARQAEVLDAVDGLIAEARGARITGWLDLYPSRLAGYKEPAVEDRLIALLDDPERAVRQLAARTLGLMSSRRAVLPLAGRLAPDAEADEAVIIEIIRALGVIGDGRAEPAVYAARVRFGTTSYVGHNTDLAYRMLPPEAPPETTDADAWVDYGRALAEKQRTEESIIAYGRALAIAPDLTRALNNRGITYRRQGRFAEAAADLDRALSRDPDFLPALINRSIVRRHRLDFAGSLVDIDRALAIAERDGKASLVNTTLRARAWSRWQAGDFAGARQDLDRVLSRDAENRQTLGMDVRYWYAAGQPERALERMRQVMARDPSFALSYQHRARLHRQIGRYAAALGDIGQARLLEPRLDDLDADEALIRRAAGDGAQVRATLDGAIAARPGDGALRIWRAVVSHAADGRWAEAAADAAGAVARAQPAEAVRFGLIRAAIHRRAGLPPPPIEPRGEIPMHDRLAARAAGGDPGPPITATDPATRCAVRLTDDLAGAVEPPAPPPGPPPFEPDPTCALLAALAQ